MYVFNRSVLDEDGATAASKEMQGTSNALLTNTKVSAEVWYHISSLWSYARLRNYSAIP